MTGRLHDDQEVVGPAEPGAGQLDPRPVITHRFKLEQIAQAIQVIKDGQAGKVILEIGA
mgnify:CR=1 FL=1